MTESKGKMSIRGRLKRASSLASDRYAISGVARELPPVTLPKLKFMEGPDPEQLGGVRRAEVGTD